MQGNNIDVQELAIYVYIYIASYSYPLILLKCLYTDSLNCSTVSEFTTNLWRSFQGIAIATVLGKNAYL